MSRDKRASQESKPVTVEATFLVDTNSESNFVTYATFMRDRNFPEAYCNTDITRLVCVYSIFYKEASELDDQILIP